MILDTNKFYFDNYLTLIELDLYNYTNSVINTFTTFTFSLLDSNTKSSLMWFSWESFFSYITALSLLYFLTLLSIYNTNNSYYLVLYLIFVVFLFAITLVLLDLDIFAGFLVLIESVVILMLFFLIIYLTPNINISYKLNIWKLWSLMFILFALLTIMSYLNPSETYIQTFSNFAFLLDDFYESLNETFISEMTGLYINLYWSNSLLIVVIGVLLLIASIICVVLTSFFTKLRNYNYNTFLEFFDIAKTCYSFIFIRKQNLSKQGRGTPSTRIFNKKHLDSSSHSEYKDKQNNFESNKNNL